MPKGVNAQKNSRLNDLFLENTRLYQFLTCQNSRPAAAEKTRGVLQGILRDKPCLNANMTVFLPTVILRR
jgi:hypothetical protein